MPDGIRGGGGTHRRRSTFVLGAAICAAALLAGCAGDAPDAVPEASQTPVAAPSAVGGSGSAPSGIPSSATAQAVPAGAFDAVLALVLERLSTGDAVAASKLFSGLPVTDEAREKAVLDAAVTRAAEVGADTGYVTLVFTDQITASKQVQQSLLDAWASGAVPAPASAPDLATEVRPILDRITHDLVPALGAVEVYRSMPECAEAVDEAASAAGREAASALSQSALDALDTAIAHLCE